MADITVQSGPRTRRSRSSTTFASPVISQAKDTPVRDGVSHVRQRLLQDTVDNSTPADQNGSVHVDASFRTDNKVSPMLASLRMTPGHMRSKQSILVRKHDEVRQKVDSLSVGGGVSIWPHMENMRLTASDVAHLACVCLCLTLLVAGIFYWTHGAVVRRLSDFHSQLRDFTKLHPLVTSRGQAELDSTVIHWHSEYKQLVDGIQTSFDMTRVPVSYLVYMLVYTATICVLFYYLIDNMFAKSKLSPKRVRRWVCLLMLTGTWTVLMAFTLLWAYRTEVAIEINIHNLAESLAEAIPAKLNCDILHSVLLYWRTRCLPPTTPGTITVLSVVSVRDVCHYIQYYSIPIITVLLTPVFKLVISLMTLYNVASPKS